MQSEQYLSEDLLQSLIEAVPFTVSIMSGIDLNVGNTTIIVNDNLSLKDINAVTNLSTEDKKALFVLSIDKTLSNVIASAICNEENMCDEDLGDVVGELTNQIVGTMKSVLSEVGVSFPLAQPKIILGEKKALLKQEEGNFDRVSIEFNCDYGQLVMQVVFAKK